MGAWTPEASAHKFALEADGRAGTAATGAVRRPPAGQLGRARVATQQVQGEQASPRLLLLEFGLGGRYQNSASGSLKMRNSRMTDMPAEMMSTAAQCEHAAHIGMRTQAHLPAPTLQRQAAAVPVQQRPIRMGPTLPCGLPTPSPCNNQLVASTSTVTHQ